MTQTQNQTLPRQFGKYVLVRKIAMGGMAEIFKAKTAGAEGFEKDVVIKRILPHFTEDEAFVKMFIDEAAITSKLQHSNIVQIYDFDVCEGSYYIAMELIEGVDLKKAIDVGIKTGKPLSVAQTVWILMELSKGLHYAHTKEYKGQPLNIVHRDISPHNAMVSYNGEVKLMDFGIAKAAQRSTKTMAGTVKGKVAYMSPEQARGKNLDGRSDLFALGIMLWEMLVGKRLFLGDSDFETLTNVLKNDAPPPSNFNPKVPKDLDEIVLKALKKDRDERYPNVEAFARDLTRWYYSNVTDLESEALKKFMHEIFAEDIAVLERLTAEEKGYAVPGDGAAPAASSAPSSRPAERAPPADAERTVAISADDSNLAATLLDGAVSQEQIKASLKAATAQAPAPAPAPAPKAPPAKPAPAPVAAAPAAAPAEKKSKAWLWILIVLLLGGGGAAAYFLTQDSGPPKKDEPAKVGEAAPEPAKVAAADKAGAAETDKAGAADKGTAADKAADASDKSTAADKAAAAPAPAKEKVSLVIEADGDKDATIKVNGKAIGTGAKMFEGDKGDKIAIEITPTKGGPAVTREVVLDGAQSVLKIPVASAEAKITVKLKTAGATVTPSKGTFTAAADGASGEITGLVVGDSLDITIEKADFETKKESIAVTGPTLELEFGLAKKAAAAAPASAPSTAKGTGSVNITATPWAQIQIDGKPSGSTPKVIQLAAGAHTILLSNGGRSVTKTVNVAGGGKHAIAHDFSK